MLEFFRRYQRLFFLFVTAVIIFSFSFSGAWSAATSLGKDPQERIVATLSDGREVSEEEIKQLAYFLGAHPPNIPNLFNDGVLERNFFTNRAAPLVAHRFFAEIAPSFQERVERARKWRPYTHPKDPSFSLVSTIEPFLPSLETCRQKLSETAEVTEELFTLFAQLYQEARYFNPETFRTFLLYQEQGKGLTPDPSLKKVDLSLFGFHSVKEWLGESFLEKVAHVILEGAARARLEGFEVSREEAKGHLLATFERAKASLQKKGQPLSLTYPEQLQLLKMRERDLTSLWQEILLFRSLVEGSGEALAIDHLGASRFASYASEGAFVELYHWPEGIWGEKGIEEYLSLVAAPCDLKKGPPTALLPLEEIAKKAPQLIETSYTTSLAEVSLEELLLRPSMREVREWQLLPAHWDRLRKEFPQVPIAKGKEGRFAALEKLAPKVRGEIDRWTRRRLIEENPQWAQEALKEAPTRVRQVSFQQGKVDLPFIADVAQFQQLLEQGRRGELEALHFFPAQEVFYRFEKIEGEARQRLLSFSEVKEEFSSAKISPLLSHWIEKAHALAQEGALPPEWIASGEDPLLDLFRLKREEKLVLRSSPVDWISEALLSGAPPTLSPIHRGDPGNPGNKGEPSFFVLKELRLQGGGYLPLLSLQKRALQADVERHTLEKLLQEMRQS